MDHKAVAAVALSVLATVALAQAEEAAQVAGSPPVATHPQARHGYSIFRETLVDLTWPEVRKAAQEKQLVLIPVGVIEEHGPHMGLGTDTYESVLRCQMLKRLLAARHVDAVIAPPVYWGVMARSQTGAYPGSFTVSPETMRALLGDVFTDLRTWGFERVFVVNHHGDPTHRGALQAAIADAKTRLGLQFYNDRERDDAEYGPQPKLAPGVKLFEPDYHAGVSETAEMAAFFPEEVDLKLAATLEPQSTFHPLGYAGDPANYGRFGARAWVETEMAFLADCIAKWTRGESGHAAQNTPQR